MTTMAATHDGVKPIGGGLDGNHGTTTWAALVANGDVGAAVPFADAADRSVQLQGTFDSGTIVIEGSNDGANYQTLRAPDSTILSFTASGLKQVLEITRWIRPRITGGVASAASVVVTLVRRVQ